MDEQDKHEVEDVTLRPAVVISRRRPKLLWGVLAAMAVSAGALAVTAGGGDSAAPNLPISLGGAGGTGAAEARSMDASLAWITYVAGDDLPALGGEAPAYRLAGNVDEAQVRRLADALSMSGEVVRDGGSWRVVAPDGATLEVYEGFGASWWYSATSPDLPVSGEGTSSGSDEATATTLAPKPTVECVPGTDCAAVMGTVDPACPSAASCSVSSPVDCQRMEAGDCPGATPAPPADLPSEAEARAIAVAVIAATGVDVTDAVVTVEPPYDAWYVTIEPRLDGVSSGLLASVLVGSKGVVMNASGFLGSPEVLGDYPILDTRGAIDRLNDQMAAGGGFFGGVAMGRDAVSTDSGVALTDDRAAATACVETSDAVTTVPCEDTAVAPPPELPPCTVQPDGSEICEGSTEPGIVCPQLGAPDEQPPPGTEVIDCPTIHPGPIPAPEPLEIVLTGATPSLVLIPANDGSTAAYLVPGYRFTGDNAEQVDAPAVADEALNPSSVPATIPNPSPVPDPTCGPLVEGDGSRTTHTVQPSPDCVVTEPVILEQGAEPQIGVGYYVEVDVVDGHCTWVAVEIGGQWWWQSLASGDLAGWSTPTEGGTFTMYAPDRAEFVGDYLRTKVAELVPFQNGSTRPLCD